MNCHFFERCNLITATMCAYKRALFNLYAKIVEVMRLNCS